MAKPRNSGSKLEISVAVQYIARAALYMSSAFMVLALVGLMFMSADPVTKGLYYVILGINALVVIGSIALKKFMQRSDKQYSDRMRPKHKGPTIDDWLAKTASANNKAPKSGTKAK